MNEKPNTQDHENENNKENIEVAVPEPRKGKGKSKRSEAVVTEYIDESQEVRRSKRVKGRRAVIRDSYPSSESETEVELSQVKVYRLV